MGQLDKLETSLDDVFNKKSPVKLPADGRKSLAGALWWLALIFGLLQLWAAWDFWRLAHWAERYLGDALLYATGMQSLGVFYYISFFVLLAAAVLSLLAAPQLKAMHKAGWNLLFYGLLLNVVYGVVRLFSEYGGFGDFLWVLLSSAVGAFLLFQVREHFVKSQPAGHKK